MKLTRDQLMMKLGAARSEAGNVWSLVNVRAYRQPKEKGKRQLAGLLVALNKDKLREVRRREGRYLLRTNLSGETPDQLWEKYILLTQIEQAFKELKGDHSIRPIYHQSDSRIEAHIFICFLAYCLHVTLTSRAATPAASTRAP